MIGRLAGVLSIFAISACESSRTAEADRAMVRDSSGIVIVENTKPRWQDRFWIVDSAPSMIVGDSASGAVFDLVGSVLVLSDSGLAMTEGEESERGIKQYGITVYDKGGRVRV